MGFPMIDFKPLERGVDALVSMAESLVKIADFVAIALLEYQDREE